MYFKEFSTLKGPNFIQKSDEFLDISEFQKLKENRKIQKMDKKGLRPVNFGLFGRKMFNS